VGGRRGEEWVVREGVGAGGRNDPSLYAHMNNKRKKNHAETLEPHLTEIKHQKESKL
jgi:hypothetical protein